MGIIDKIVSKSILAKTRFLTLLELMIVITIIALSAGIIGFSVQKAIVYQQFQTEVSILVDELRLAQNLMLILGSDIHVKFKADAQKNISYSIESETDLPNAISKDILRKKFILKNIKAFHHKDAKDNELNLKFLSHGNVMSDGIITLSTTSETPVPEGVLQAYICLAGYPKTINSFTTLEEAKKHCESIQDQQFDRELTEDTFQRPPEKPIGPKVLETQKHKAAG